MVNKCKVGAILATLLLSGALTGCDAFTSSPRNIAETTKPIVQKKYDIKVFSTRIQPNPDSEVMRQVQEKLGQNLIVSSVPDINYADKMNLLYASNDLPDVFSVFWNDDILKNATAKFTEEDFKTYMPQSYAIALKQYKDYGETKESIFNRFTVGGKLAGLFIGQTFRMFILMVLSFDKTCLMNSG